MKQLLGLFVLVALALGLAPGAFADENGTNQTNSTNETYVKPMQEGVGAEMRLLQLEKQLVRAQLHGEQVIERLEAQNMSTGNLSRIVAEFEAMIVEVQEARADLNRTNRTDNAVRVFVALVHDARALTKEFREESRELLRDADKRQLRADFERIDRDELENIEDRIKKARREYNAQNTKKTLERIGYEKDGNDDLYKRVKEGRVSDDDLREEIKERVSELTPEQREEAIARLREEAAKARVAALARIEAAQKDLKNVEARYEARIKLAEEKGIFEIRERIKYVEDKDDRKERLEVRQKTEIRTENKYDDDKYELEVEAEVYTDVTIVEVEMNDRETTFRTTAQTREEVVNEVARKFGLDRAKVAAVLEFEVKREASTDDDSDDDDENDMNDDGRG